MPSRAHTGAALGLLALGVLAAGLCGRNRASDRAGQPHRIQDAGTALGQTIVKGRVVDVNGSSLPGVHVGLRRTVEGAHAVPASRSVDRSGEAITATLTDENGEFSLKVGPDVDPSSLDLVARAEGHATTAIPLAEAPDPIEITLDTTATLRGQLSAPANLEAAYQDALLTLAGSGVWPPRVLTVDAHGGFEAAALPEGVYEMTARLGTLAGRTSQPISLEPGEDRTVSFSLRHGAEVAVAVTEAASQAPITGVNVSLMDDALSSRPVTARTDLSGHAQLRGLLPGKHRVSLELSGYVPVIGAPLPSGRGPHRFRLQRAASVRGRVVDANGDPLAGARLQVRGTARDGSPIHLQTGPAAGSTLPPLAPGPPTVASGESLGVTRGPVPKIPITPAPAEAEERSLRLTHGRSGRSHGLTDKLGAFELQGIPAGNISISAQSKDGRWGLSRPLQVEPGQHLRGVEVVIPDVGELLVRVLDSGGTPATQVPLELVAEAEVVPRFGITDQRGEFVFGGLAGTCTVTARPHGQRPTSGETLVEADQANELVLYVSESGYRLSGRVFGANGQPLALARLSIVPASPVTAAPGEPGTIAPIAGVSGRDGTFELPGLPAPPWDLHVSHEGHARLRKTISNDTDSLELRMSVGHSLRGQVESDAGKSVAGVRIGLVANETTDTSAQAPPRAIRQTTVRAGTFEFRGVAAGDYNLIIDDKKFVLTRRPVTIDPDPRVDNRVELTLVRVGTASGTVVDRLGGPVLNAIVTVDGTDAGRPPPTTVTNGDGEFVLAGIGPGDAIVSARHLAAGEGTSSNPVRIGSGETSPGVVVRLPGVVPPGDAGVPEEVARIAAAQGASPTGPATTVDRGDLQSTAGARRRIFTQPPVALAAGKVGVVIEQATGAAVEAGVRPGDRLLQVDGEPVLSAGQGRSMLRGLSGSHATLTLRRDGRPFRIRLRRP